MRQISGQRRQSYGLSEVGGEWGKNVYVQEVSNRSQDGEARGVGGVESDGVSLRLDVRKLLAHRALVIRLPSLSNATARQSAPAPTAGMLGSLLHGRMDDLSSYRLCGPRTLRERARHGKPKAYAGFYD